MTLTMAEKLLAGWLAATGLWAWALFAYDKLVAGRPGARRVSEWNLCLISALGGWPGGLLGLMLFRHKSAKGSFQAKFAVAFVVWVGLVGGALRLTGRI